MKGWVGLVGWPIEDGLPTLVVTHQLQVKRRTGKVRRPETDVLPLCHATNDTIRDVILTCELKSWHESAKSITRNRQLKGGREKLKTKKRICSEVSANSLGNPWSQSGRRKGRLRWEGLLWFAEKEWKSEGMMDDESGESMEPIEEVPLEGLGEAELERLVRGWRREAVADGPARRGASRAPCCRQRWTSLRSTGRRASDASIVNLVRRSGLLHGASTFVELSWQHVATIDVPLRNFLKSRGLIYKNILRQSYNYLTIMPKLRSTYDGRLSNLLNILRRAQDFLGYNSLAKSYDSLR